MYNIKQEPEEDERNDDDISYFITIFEERIHIASLRPDNLEVEYRMQAVCLTSDNSNLDHAPKNLDF